MFRNDGEEVLLCPFNNSHLILKSRMATHLTQCKKDYPASPLVLCPFNGLHYMEKERYQAHIQICPSKENADRHVFQNGPEARDVAEFVLKQAVTDGKEDWDECLQPSYLEVRDDTIKAKPVFIMGPTNAGKAARRALRQRERLRMQQLNQASSAPEKPTNNHCRGGSGTGARESPKPSPSSGRGRGRGTRIA